MVGHCLNEFKLTQVKPSIDNIRSLSFVDKEVSLDHLLLCLCSPDCKSELEVLVWFGLIDVRLVSNGFIVSLEHEFQNYFFKCLIQ